MSETQTAAPEANAKLTITEQLSAYLSLSANLRRLRDQKKSIEDEILKTEQGRNAIFTKLRRELPIGARLVPLDSRFVAVIKERDDLTIRELAVLGQGEILPQPDLNGTDDEDIPF